ncbi:hypothetical protein GCM10020219_011860 [Nonomuraea dietziae]
MTGRLAADIGLLMHQLRETDLGGEDLAQLAEAMPAVRCALSGMTVAIGRPDAGD